MKITRIRIYKTDLPYVGGGYVWGAGNAIETAKASIVVIDTDAGLQGCGEFTPCGENYMIAHSEGVEAFARLAASKLLGEDPRQVAKIEQIMDHTVQGHGYAKAPFDAACWDILGQACDQPYIDGLNRKSLYAFASCTEAQVCDTDCPNRVTVAFEALSPFTEFLVKALSLSWQIPISRNELVQEYKKH